MLRICSTKLLYNWVLSINQRLITNMDFSRLPDGVSLQIFGYLPLEEQIRVRRVNKTFHRIGQLAISHTKSLDLTERRFKNLSPDQLAVILKLCSPILERIKFPESNGNHTPREDWIKWGQYVIKLSRSCIYPCPQLIDIDFGDVAIHQAVFNRLVRNSPNMESLRWSNRFVGFPNITHNNLKKLDLFIVDDDGLQSITGRCPNLKIIYLNMHNNFPIDTDVMDRFLASIPQLEGICITVFGDGEPVHAFESELVNLWTLPLTALCINFSEDDSPGDSLLFKVAASFPRLKQLRLETIDPTNAGIESLAALQELETLELTLFESGHYEQGIRQLATCTKLRKFNMCSTNMSGGALVNLLRSCPQLDHVIIWEITQVATPQEATVILESLAGMAKRDITIDFRSGKVDLFKSIWEEESVKAVIKKLEEKDGMKIKIDCKEWYVEEAEFDSDSDDDDM